MRQPNWHVYGKLCENAGKPALSAFLGIFRRGPCAFEETPSEHHQEDQAAAVPPRSCLWLRTEVAERIYWQIDLNPARFARALFGWEVLAFWLLCSWCTGPTAARLFPAYTDSRCRGDSSHNATPSWLLKGAGNPVNKGNPVDALYLGFHKAFDRISQKRLLKKLRCQGWEEMPC